MGSNRWMRKAVYVFHCLLSDVFYIIIISNYYLATCLRICSMSEVYDIDRKPMHVDAMTKKVEVIFSEECKRLLDLCDAVGTKGDKKHAKREAKSRLKQKYYWVHKE